MAPINAEYALSESHKDVSLPRHRNSLKCPFEGKKKNTMAKRLTHSPI